MLKLLILLSLLAGCAAIKPPADFTYRPVSVENFEIASWQKITNPNAEYRIYIEGDGSAFNAHGRPTTDPTPRGELVRRLAFNDPAPNVVYLARPCQYLKSGICSQRHWTTARFAPEIINAEYEAVRKIAGDAPVVLIGFSGGAQVAGLIAAAKSGLDVRKIITIAGNLDHLGWTQYHKLPPLNESMNLESYRHRFAQIPQIHFVGAEDKNITPDLVKNFIGSNAEVIEVGGADHSTGWESVYSRIYNEN